MPRKYPISSTVSGTVIPRAATSPRSFPFFRSNAGAARAAWLLTTLGILALVAACTGGSEPSISPSNTSGSLGGQSGRVEGGTVIWAPDDRPTTLNAAVEQGNTSINGHITAAILSPLWRIRPDFTFEPLLLDGEPKITHDPFAVTYTLKKDLHWSDGEPITAADVVFTYRTLVNPEFKIASRRGYDQVRTAKVLDQRRAKFVFRRPYGGWRSMFSGPRGAILPRHLLRGRNFDAVWQDDIPISSGPFEFDQWERGQYIVLKRNENFWGARAALDEVVLDFSNDLEGQLQALQDRDVDRRVDVLTPQPSAEVRDRLEQIDGIEIDVVPGTLWEHIDFNTAAPPLNHRYVRQALAMAVDREALADELLGAVYPGIAPLNNILWLSNQPAYTDHWSRHIEHDPAGAQRLLVTNGCTLPDGVWRCEGKDLELDYATTAEVPLRAQQFDMIARDLQAIGVRLREKAARSDVVFKPSFLASDHKWDLFSFARRGTANPLDGQLPWQCDAVAAVNNTKYCNRKVDRLFEVAATQVDERLRNKALADADLLIAGDVPTLPLYQRPTLLVWNSAISGPQNNPSEWGPLWNVGEWFLTQ